MAMTTTPSSSEHETQGSDGRQGGRRGRDGRLRRVWGRRTSRLAVGVAAAAVALTAAAVAFAQGIGTFRDVPSNHYARDSVQWAVQNGITFGCLDGTSFCPEDTVNRAQSVTFLHRYQNNVISPLENRVSALEGRSGQTPGNTGNTGFGNEPTPSTTLPLRKFTTRGTQTTTSRSFNFPAGKYLAVFTLEAAEPADTIDVDPVANGIQPVTLIRVEYRDRSSNVWKTHAVSSLVLTASGGTLPSTTSLLSELPATGSIEVQVEDVPGRLPPSGFLRVSAYTDATSPDGTNRTTRYNFDWGIVLTEIRP
ncbi:MAG: S-layer homology domain-containing protein [Acidimicrobiaceae bacterium]|nr:S-layer homology domain-containing protein [Acidimicrobiaceae bacterium]